MKNRYFNVDVFEKKATNLNLSIIHDKFIISNTTLVAYGSLTKCKAKNIHKLIKYLYKRFGSKLKLSLCIMRNFTGAKIISDLKPVFSKLMYNYGTSENLGLYIDKRVKNKLLEYSKTDNIIFGMVKYFFDLKK